jgi:hypothetical protein
VDFHQNQMARTILAVMFLIVYRRHLISIAVFRKSTEKKLNHVNWFHWKTGKETIKAQRQWFKGHQNCYVVP